MQSAWQNLDPVGLRNDTASIKSVVTGEEGHVVVHKLHYRKRVVMQHLRKRVKQFRNHWHAHNRTGCLLLYFSCHGVGSGKDLLLSKANVPLSLIVQETSNICGEDMPIVIIVDACTRGFTPATSCFPRRQNIVVLLAAKNSATEMEGSAGSFYTQTLVKELHKRGYSHRTQCITNLDVENAALSLNKRGIGYVLH